MRILLVQSYTILNQPPIFPIGLSYLASAVEENHDVQIFDMNLYDDPYQPLREKISKFAPEVIGVSLRNVKVQVAGKHESSFQPHVETFRKIKEWVPNIKIIAGGTAFSLFAEVIMERIPEIDLGFFGEGEERFPLLLDNLETPCEVEGVYFRKENGDIEFSGFPKFIDFSQLSPPTHDLVDMGKYTSEAYCIGIQSKRGCILECQHCCDKYLVGNTIRLRDANKVVDEIEELYTKHNVERFFFADQIFNIPKGHAEEICKELIMRNLNVKWSAWFNEKNVDEDFFRLMKRAGCYLIDCSPDGVADRVLEGYHKNVRKQDLEKAVACAKKADIPITFSFMINGPHDSFKSILELVWFIVKTKAKLRGLFKMHMNCIVPLRIYPHSELQSVAIRRGVISRNDDLIEPRFYNLPPLRYVASIITGSLALAWHAKQLVRKLIKKT